MEHLGKIFNSSARVKIMRLFLFNEKSAYDLEDIIKRSKVASSSARSEIKILEGIGFLKKKTFVKEVSLHPKGKKKKTTTKSTKSKKQKVDITVGTKKVKSQGWILNKKFPLIRPLWELLIESELVRTKDLPERFKAAGKVKMLVLSGIFVKDDERSVDVLVVGDKLDHKKLGSTMRTLESEVGKELRYSVFTPEEFRYRLDMYDQHLLDIFEYPHERVVDKLKIN